jgi:predicted transcriptional regulator
MPRTRHEMHVDILKVLARHGPLKISHIMYQVSINCHVLKQCLDFLVQRNLVEKRALSEKRDVYAITERSRTILKYNWEVTSLQTKPVSKQLKRHTKSHHCYTKQKLNHWKSLNVKYRKVMAEQKINSMETK